METYVKFNIFKKISSFSHISKKVLTIEATVCPTDPAATK
jgi:hypothetical protein